MRNLRWPMLVALALIMTPIAALAGPSTNLQQIDVDAVPMFRVPATNASAPTMSADGRFITFRTYVSLVPADINVDGDIYVYDRETEELEFLGVPDLAPEVAESSWNGVISADGRYVVFYSDSAHFVPDDNNETNDVFLYDRVTGTHSRVNLTADGNEADAPAFSPTISGDGRFVAFETSAALVPEDENGELEIYIVDTTNGTVERLNENDHRTRSPSLSADGRYVAFDSLASDLVDGDTNDDLDVFVKDRETGAVTRASVTSTGEQANDPSTDPSISADGRYVVFDSRAANLSVDGSTSVHLYLHDRETGKTEQIDVSGSGESANDLSSFSSGTSTGPLGQVISADGRYVVFRSWASNLVENDTNNHTDVFIRDREAGTTEIVNLSVAGIGGETGSFSAVISSDGQFVAFESESNNLVYFDDDDGIVQGHGVSHVFVRDMQGTFPPTPFEVTHDRTDLPVAQGQAQRTWTWAPEPFTEVFYEPYGTREDSNIVPFEHRAVQYYDKARMEITRPTDDPNSVWYVTNGLLVMEMITGELQVSDADRMQLDAAWVNVAGDANDPNGPTYASLAELRDASPHPFNQPITARVDRSGDVVADPALASFGVGVAVVDDFTGHAIAAPFWGFMNSSGTIWNGEAFVQGQLFDNPYFATGRPVTEAYWAEVLVGGQPREVLMQCFERRCLTYTPGNPEGFVVEAGNVGLHYYNWRYSLQPLAPDLDGKIVYTDGFHLNVIDRDGVLEVLKAPDGFRVDSPAWSPDGTQIAYLLREGFGRGDLYVVDADGSNVRHLTFNQEVDSASWSPSGDRLVFGADGMVTIISPDGSSRTEIGPGHSPAWSPVAEDRIAFIDGVVRESLKTMDVNGGNVVDVVNGPVDLRSGSAAFDGYAWSPDGRQFAYSGSYVPVASFVPNYQLYAINADGTGGRRIDTGGSEGYNPGWSPDGSQLTYAREHVVYLVNPDGTDVRGLIWDFSTLVRGYDWIGSS